MEQFTTKQGNNINCVLLFNIHKVKSVGGYCATDRKE